MENRKCTKCNEHKELNGDNFQPDKRYEKGFSKWCKECHTSASRNWSRIQKESNSDFWKNNALRKHHVDLVWYEQKLSDQKQHCALCEAITSSKGERLGIDHDHKHCKGKYGCKVCVRGLLCSSCNARIGFVEQILEQSTTWVPKWDTWLENALLYLTKYGSR